MSTANSDQPAIGTARVKRGMAEMLKGGVIMDVVTPDQAKIAEDAGAVAGMALERGPADIRKEGADELLAEVEEAAYQVFVARKFYNDLVAVTRDARRRPLARVLHLSGHADAPVFFEMDDSLIADKPGAWMGPAGHTMV